MKVKKTVLFTSTVGQRLQADLYHNPTKETIHVRQGMLDKGYIWWTSDPDARHESLGLEPGHLIDVGQFYLHPDECFWLIHAPTANEFGEVSP